MCNSRPSTPQLHHILCFYSVPLRVQALSLVSKPGSLEQSMKEERSVLSLLLNADLLCIFTKLFHLSKIKLLPGALS